MSELNDMMTRRSLLKAATTFSAGAAAALAMPALTRRAFAAGENHQYRLGQRPVRPVEPVRHGRRIRARPRQRWRSRVASRSAARPMASISSEGHPVGPGQCRPRWQGTSVRRQGRSGHDVLDAGNVKPVADTCEAGATPCISTVAPWEAVYFGRGAKPGQPSPFKWTYHFSFGASDFAQLYADQFAKIETNKKLGVLLTTIADGNAIRGVMIPQLQKAGLYRGRCRPYENGITDFTAQITPSAMPASRSSNTFPFPPDFPVSGDRPPSRGWPSRSRSSGGQGRAVRAGMEALGDLGHGVASGAYWHRAFPFTSPVTGLDCNRWLKASSRRAASHGVSRSATRWHCSMSPSAPCRHRAIPRTRPPLPRRSRP